MEKPSKLKLGKIYTAVEAFNQLCEEWNKPCLCPVVFQLIWLLLDNFAENFTSATRCTYDGCKSTYFQINISTKIKPGKKPTEAPIRTASLAQIFTV